MGRGAARGRGHLAKKDLIYVIPFGDGVVWADGVVWEHSMISLYKRIDSTKSVNMQACESSKISLFEQNLIMLVIFESIYLPLGVLVASRPCHQTSVHQPPPPPPLPPPTAILTLPYGSPPRTQDLVIQYSSALDARVLGAALPDLGAAPVLPGAAAATPEHLFRARAGDFQLCVRGDSAKESARRPALRSLSARAAVAPDAREWAVV